MGAIEWTGRSDWNPVRGCSRENEACVNCYAEVMAARFSDPGLWGHGFAKRVKVGGKTDHRWTGKVEVQHDRIAIPLGWRKPTFCFVNSTSDIFHPKVAFADLDKLFAVMALTPHVTYQILTKRPARQREYAATKGRLGLVCNGATALGRAGALVGRAGWPLPNVWLGTSVHDQPSADEFIPELLATPAAVRFVSYEPALGPVDFSAHLGVAKNHDDLRGLLHQIIVGGESGHGARPFLLGWARSVILQCRAAGTAVFVKQLGSNPQDNTALGGPRALKLKSSKGGDKAEWPRDLRVRQMPKGAAR